MNFFYIKNKNKGFTLIELLVVIAIIGILSTVVLVSINSARSRARDTKRMSDIKQIDKALQMYMLNNDGQAPQVGDVDDRNWGQLENLLAPAYIKVLPKDPLSSPGLSNGEYAYKYYSPNTLIDYYSYRLEAQLEKGTVFSVGADLWGNY